MRISIRVSIDTGYAVTLASRFLKRLSPVHKPHRPLHALVEVMQQSGGLGWVGLGRDNDTTRGLVKLEVLFVSSSRSYLTLETD